MDQKMLDKLRLVEEKYIEIGARTEQPDFSSVLPILPVRPYSNMISYFRSCSISYIRIFVCFIVIKNIIIF